MSPEIYEQAKKIIEQSWGLPEAIRKEHIERLCAGKPELLQYVRQQLSGVEEAGRAIPTRNPLQGPAEIPVRLGQFEIKALIGQGGMGQVFRAWDPYMGRIVAIKTIRIGGTIDFVTNRESLLAEMKLGGKLTGINGIVMFHHADVDEASGVAYIVMEFIEGYSLQSMIKPGHPFDQPVALGILKAAALALDQAHARGVVHCDVKPSNILLQQGRAVKITDFGISRFKEPGADPETSPAQGLGTPEYMSPEQFLGSKALDGRSDQFSLAVVAFQLLTGRLPFEGSPLTVREAILGDERPAASFANGALPSSVNEPLKRALARDEKARFGNCAGFVGALTAALGQEPPLDEPTTELADPLATVPTHPDNLRKAEAFKEQSSKRRNKIAYAALAVVAIAALSSAAVRFNSLLPWRKHAAPPAPSVRRFVVEPTAIKQGGSALLKWDVSGADQIVIDHGVGKVKTSGSFQVRPESTTTYVLNASGDGGDASSSAVIEILPRDSGKSNVRKAGAGGGAPPVQPGPGKVAVPLPVISKFEAEPAIIAPGQVARLGWEISGADVATIDQGVGNVVPVTAGSVEVRPALTTQYTLSATNMTGETPANITVTVRAPSMPAAEAETLLRNGTKQLERHEYEQARDSLLRAAQGGNPESMVLAGAMYSEGLGGAKDDSEAVRWFQQAAAAGNVRGMYNLGLMSANGWEGHRKSDFEAANWYAKAVKGGSTDAAYRLGMMYEQGKGVPKDLNEARELYQTAGTPEAKSRLAMLPSVSSKSDPTVQRPPAVLTLHSISPSPIQENKILQYTLSGSGFSLDSEIRLDVDGFVGNRPDRANHRPVEVGLGGFWLKIYISVPSRQGQQLVHVIVHNPDGQEVRMETRTRR